MEMGYTFVWPTSQDPYFIRPDGMIIRLMVENYMSYLVPNARHCKPRKPSGTRIFCSTSTSTIMNAQSGAPERRDLNIPEPIVATPSDSEISGDDNISRLDDFDAPVHDGTVREEEQSSSGDEAEDRGIHYIELSLRGEANSLYHLLTHKPKNPFCESCRRAKMKEKRKYSGSYKNTATRWGQLVIGDHIVSTQDNMLGIDGSRDILVLKDAFSGFKAAYPMPDRKADSTSGPIRHFMGDRKD
jgi:hypothetical protein